MKSSNVISFLRIVKERKKNLHQLEITTSSDEQGMYPLPSPAQMAQITESLNGLPNPQKTHSFFKIWPKHDDPDTLGK